MRDPKRYAELEAKYPMSTVLDDFRMKHGEPRSRALKRIGPAGGVPLDMRKPMTEEERAAMRAGIREWKLDYALAKEQAQGVY